MNTSRINHRTLRIAIASAYALSQHSWAGPTIIAPAPLANPASGVAPNIMFILDNSGSMDQDYTPDYVNDNLCRDAFEDRRFNSSGTDKTLSSQTQTYSADNKDDDTTLDACNLGDPPFTAQQFNFQYYNPATVYRPGYDPALAPPGPGLDYNMTTYNTPALWAAVRNDPYSSNTPSGTRNLVYGNSDVVYCNVKNPSTAQQFDTTVCKEPIDFSGPFALEGAGTGTWRYPNTKFEPAGTSGSPSPLQTAANFVYRINRTGTATNKIAPYFYTITKLNFCKNAWGATAGTFPTAATGTGNSPTKARFGKGAPDTLAAGTDPCYFRRVTYQGTTFQYPRFGTLTYNSAHDTQALNTQEGTCTTTPSTAGCWTGMTGWKKFQIVETVAGNNTLPATYPSRADAAVYGVRLDCGNAPCTYTQEMTNYANWHAYYRFRLNMMKTSAGRAFFGVNQSYRVGFITINPGSSSSAVTVTSTHYLPLDVFTDVTANTTSGTTQRSNWYSKFYAQRTQGSTPLREALSRVGRHYAGVTGASTNGINAGMGFAAGSVNPQGLADSVIASCQQNFAVLTTDGYWNGNEGKLVSGSAMTNQDNNLGSVGRPFYDNATPNEGTKSLADVAMYYWKTDLRTVTTGTDPWINNVPTTNKDQASWQHMTTFTVGLGLEGRVQYQPNYDAGVNNVGAYVAAATPTGDFKDIITGAQNWGEPVANGETALDDLWHAAVNGRGKFFSAKNPDDLSDGLTEALASVAVATGAGAAAATSTQEPVPGDQLAFTAEYQTVKWDGDLKAHTLDLTLGQVSSRVLWSARDILDLKAPATRNIWTYTTDTANFSTKIKAFTWTGGGSAYLTDTNLTATEQSYFNAASLTQYATMSPTARTAATPKTMVNWMRGDTTNEDTGNNLNTDLYRNRDHILGDIINAQPVYIKKAPFDYADNGYQTFKSGTASRLGVVLVAANDGMLHGFTTDPDNRPYYQINGILTTVTTDDTFSDTLGGTNDGGGETWAYIPSQMVPRLYSLLDNDYKNNHQWFVDASPIVEDICVSNPCAGASDWRTIVIAGLNGGGRGYYALDITDPTAPVGMWEFKVRTGTCAATPSAAVGSTDDCDLGLTYGNPIVAKVPPPNTSPAAGTWVVFVTSGYNNFNPGDGGGWLYMLDAQSGRILSKTGTGVGFGGTSPSFADADPSGLSRINTFHPLGDQNQNNSPVRIYGTDMKGNVWRFDLTGQVTPNPYLVATVKDPSGNRQPITTAPEMNVPGELQSVAYSNPWEAPAAVYIGTGRFLGNPDKADLQRQTIYAIKDQPGVTSTLTNPRSNNMVQRDFGAEFTAVVAGATLTLRSITCASGSTADVFTTKNGWFADFPLNPPSIGVATGERVNVDFQIQAGTLIIPSNIPELNSCTAGGTGFVNFINADTGCPINTGSSTVYVSQKSTGSLIVGINVIKLPSGQIKTIATTADNKQITLDTPVGGKPFTGKRLGWRELTTQ